MPGASPLLALAYPVAADNAAPSGVQTLAQQLEKYLVGIFVSSAARDSAWTAAGGARTGALAYITGTGELQLRTSTAWVVIGGGVRPFAQAIGTFTWSLAGATNVTVTGIAFPAGRFSAIPIITIVGQTGAAGTDRIIYRVAAITTASMNMNMSTADGSALTIGAQGSAFHAVQMTTATSAG